MLPVADPIGVTPTAYLGAGVRLPPVSSPRATTAQKGSTTILSKADISNPDEVGTVEFGITCRELDEHTSVISVEGDLDLSTAPRLKWMLLDSLQEGRDKIVLDLSLTCFMDSTALGVLVVVNRRLAADARLGVACDRAAVLRIFELSGMDGAFAIFPTLEEALAYVHAPATGAV
jgi:anti-sigma B factor antagonist